MASGESNAALHPNEKIALGDFGGRMFAIGTGLGVALLLAAVVLGASAGWDRFFHSYLVAFAFYLSLTLGAMFFVIIQHLVRAGWSVTVRRIAELATQTFPLLAVLFLVIVIPTLADYGGLYGWVTSDEHLVHAKQGFLNAPFFLFRAVLYFAVWIGVTRWFFRRSVAQDQSADPELTERMRVAAGPSLIGFAFSTCYAGFDLLMSLHPAWYSTMFGVYFFAGCALSVFAYLSIAGMVLQRQGFLLRSITVEHYHDLGKFLFGFVFFWGYISFSQFMLIWYADIPEETAWYMPRMATSWSSLSLLLLFGHFLIPFVFLLSRETKRRLGLLLAFSVWMLAMHYFDLYWIVMPEYSPKGFVPDGAGILVDLCTLVGIGGLWVGWMARVARKTKLIPVGDPRLPESLAFENY